jgi:hypothetical protein
MNASLNPTPSTGPEKMKDYGNLLCVVMFLSLMITSLLQREWIDGTCWGCLGGAFALMSPAHGISGGRWKQPRSLAAIGLLVVGIAFILARVWMDFTAPRH